MPNSARPKVEFRALGPAQLVGPAGTDPDAVLARPKLLGLLAYLSAGASRGFHRRDTLIGCFWPELNQDRARSALRQSLYRLRQSLGEPVVVTRGDEEVALSEEDFWSDVSAFDEAIARGDRADALRLYRGDLLEGLYVSDAPVFERWLDERRMELRQRASTAAWTLAEVEASLRHTDAAGQWSRDARNLAPFDERLLQRVIGLLDRLGDRAGAVREYETFARRLGAEMELEPSPETKALIDGVRARIDPLPGDVHAVSAGSAIHVAAAEPPVTASPPPAGGPFAERYRLEQLIGAGGMSTVYRARDLRHERDVAVKMMRASVSAHLGAERFHREIRIAAKLAHPHIVPVYDSGTDDGQLYYVMPLIQGESLRQRLEREGQLSLEEALGYARDVASALAYAHGQGVVHRDVKPENILLAGDRALVADFGIARAVAAGEATRITGSGMAIGTPSYMSPEQAAGDREVDHRADLYSLGCVLYEMLAGKPPFTGLTAEATVRQHLTVAANAVTDFRPNVPAHVAEAIAKALAKTPADRFAGADQFARALLAPGERRRQSSWRRRIAAIVALSAVGVAVALTVQWRQTPTLNQFRVVVVPFDNQTGDTSLALVGNLAADWITRGLQEIDIIEIVPTATSIFPGPSIQKEADDPGRRSVYSVGRLARAGTVVAGAYYRRGDALEFQTQIIDAANERLVRAVEPVVAPRTASGTGLDSLRRAVVTAVAAALDRRLLGSPAASAPPSLEAYRAYIEGHRAFFHPGPMRMREVLAFMYRAVALDSMFYDPRFFLVMAHINLGERRAADSNAQLLLPFRSQLGPHQRANLDWLVASLRGDRAGALRTARVRGVAADVAVEALWSNRPRETIEILSRHQELTRPTFFYKWSALMEALHMVGQHERELREARRARRVFPDRLRMLGNEVQALAALGRIDELERVLDDGLLVTGEEVGGVSIGELMFEAADELRAHGYLEESRRVAERGLAWFASRRSDDLPGKVRYASVLYASGLWEAARDRFRELDSIAPGETTVQAFLGVLAARRGDRDEALRRSARLDSLAEPYRYGEHLFWQARIAAQLGERDRAVDLLRQSFNRGRLFDASLHRNMDLQSLRGHPPFEEFLTPRQ